LQSIFHSHLKKINKINKKYNQKNINKKIRKINKKIRKINKKNDFLLYLVAAGMKTSS
jgi:hypothetical protein